jgi:hypothetical protein
LYRTGNLQRWPSTEYMRKAFKHHMEMIAEYNIGKKNTKHEQRNEK